MDQLYKIVTTIATDFKWLAILILFLSIFVDIHPKVKWNPWKAIFNRLGKYINNSIETEIAGFKADVYKKIDDLGDEQKAQFECIRKEQEEQAETLNSLIQDLNYKELSRLRWDVVDFDSGINRGNKYPREQYRHVIDEATKFLRMIEADSDNKLVVDPDDILSIQETIQRIQIHYEEHKADNNSYMI